MSYILIKSGKQRNQDSPLCAWNALIATGIIQGTIYNDNSKYQIKKDSHLFRFLWRSARVVAVQHGKVFPYSLPSVGPGDDPGVQAVNLQVSLSHPPGGRLPLISARPAVTSVAFTRWRHTAAHIWFQPTIHLSTLKKWKAELAGLADIRQMVYPQ